MQSRPEVVGFLLKSNQSWDILQIKEKCRTLSLVLHTGVLCLIFLTVHEREGRVLRDVDLRMQIRWLDWVCITLSSNHNASSTTSGPGHADRITSARLHLSFQCVCGGQHPDRGCKLMPSVNAAFSFILVRFRFKTANILLFFFFSQLNTSSLQHRSKYQKGIRNLSFSMFWHHFDFVWCELLVSAWRSINLFTGRFFKISTLK